MPNFILQKNTGPILPAKAFIEPLSNIKPENVVSEKRANNYK